MIQAYRAHEAERHSQGIPPLPLNPEQTAQLCVLLENPPAGEEQFLLNLLKERVSPGVDPSAKVKAEFLAAVVTGTRTSPLLSKVDAIRMLGAMIGGYNVDPLVKALSDAALADEAACALSGLTLVYDGFAQVVELAAENVAAKKVLVSWADADWFTNKPGVPDTDRKSTRLNSSH